MSVLYKNVGFTKLLLGICIVMGTG